MPSSTARTIACRSDSINPVLVKRPAKSYATSFYKVVSSHDSSSCVSRSYSGYETRALQRNPHVVLLDTDWYHNDMKPVLAEWCILWLEKNHVGGRDITREQLIKFMLEAWSHRDEGLHAHLTANLTAPQV
jgi:hypothetical protein